MAINFTDSPSNGDTITADGRTYTYNSSTAKWKITATSPAANPTLTAIASGALANGDMIIVNSDGTVSAVAGTAPIASALGSETVFDDSTVNDGSTPTAVFDSNSNKVVVAYRDGGNSNYGTAVVGTVSGNSISFGSQVVFNSAATSGICATFDSNSNKVVFIYEDLITQTIGGSTYNTKRGTAIVGTVSGTSISFGSETIFEAISPASNPNGAVEFSYGAAIAFDSNSNKVVISYTYRGGAYSSSTNSGWHAAVRVGTVSGTSISFGSRVLFNGTKGSDGTLPLTFDSNSNKIVLVYRDGNNSDSSRSTKAIVGTVSGTSISFGSAVSVSSNGANDIALAFDSNSNKVVVLYFDQEAAGAARVGTVSGTSISFGTEVTGITTGGMYDNNVVFDSNANKVIISYLDVANSWYGTLRECTVSGTSLTLGSAEVYNSAESDNRFGSVFDSNSNKVVFVYRDRGNSQRKTARVKQVSGAAGTNLTASNYIGVSDGAYANSATATIQLMGSVDDAQSGLTAGQSYYVQNNGTLSTSTGSLSVFAGTAISATKLIVKGEIAAAAAAGLLVSGGGVTTYANIAALPSSGNTGGDLAFVTDVKAFYGWDGTEWDRVFSGKNMLPEFTTSPDASYDLESDGTATTVNVAATDPEGFAVTYSHDTSPTNQAQATITQSGGTFTVTPSTTTSNGGTFTARFKAFDGVRTNSASSTFNLSFNPGGITPYGYWDMGRTDSYSGSGTTWTDISSNSNNMTLSGYEFLASSSQHSVRTMYFNAAGDHFSIPANVRSNAKTYVFIFYPQSSANFIMMGDWSTSRYSFYFLNGNTSAGAFQSPGFNTWTGETKRHYINGNTPKTTRDAAYDALDHTKYNMAAVTGLNATAHNYKWMGYSSGNRIASQVRAVLAYDSILSGTQLAAISSSFSSALGSSNMTAWS